MLILFFFFFFKQKTAYEMRISDWSSDVCSSDLCLVVADADDLVSVCEQSREVVPDYRLDVCRAALARNVHIVGRACVPEAAREQPGRDGWVLEQGERPRGAPGIELVEFGRASCRERVCQYG